MKQGEKIGRSVELLAPAGAVESADAAIYNGADAVYVGLPGFNARNRKSDLSREDFSSIVAKCRLYGVRVFVASNILLFNDEIPEFLEAAGFALRLGVDAFIVQDPGAIKLIRHLSESTEIHISTQADAGSVQAIDFYRDLGASRITLPRELSLNEIRLLREHTNLELEVFIHGALCVSYSGHCYTSLGLGGRSGNRGQCAQNCRMDYEYIENGETLRHGYFFSPSDLSASPVIDELLEIGIDSFKIEGRKKSPEYVAAAVQYYSGMIRKDIKRSLTDVALTFSRGYNAAWLRNDSPADLITADYNGHRGVEAGRVAGVKGRRIFIDSVVETLRKGDGVVIFSESGPVVGGPVYEIQFPGKDSIEIEFSRDTNIQSVKPGHRIFLTGRPELDSELRKSHLEQSGFGRVSLKLFFFGLPGAKLQLKVEDSGGNVVTVESSSNLQKAQGAPLDRNVLLKTAGAFGRTPFHCSAIEYDFPEPVFMHGRELKQMRQEAVERITELRSGTVEGEEDFDGKVNDILSTLKTERESLKNELTQSDLRISLLLRLPFKFNLKGYLDSISAELYDNLYLDIPDVDEAGHFLDIITGLQKGSGIVLPRIHTPEDVAASEAFFGLTPDVFIATSLSGAILLHERELPMILDTPLNITNFLSESIYSYFNADFLVDSPEFASDRLSDFLKTIRSGHMEWRAYSRISGFHMRNCIYTLVHSQGKKDPACGRICRKKEGSVKDLRGEMQRLFADSLCHNTTYLERPDDKLNLAGRMYKSGIRNFRVEDLIDNPVRTEKVLRSLRENCKFPN